MFDPKKVTEPLSKVLIAGFNRLFLFLVLFGIWITFILLIKEPDLLSAFIQLLLKER